jgi:hypothetical protein
VGRRAHPSTGDADDRTTEGVLACGIIRRNGVQLGKIDYIAPFMSA